MSSLSRVVWAEGMLMSPQHFQQQDGYHEALLDARVAAVAPHPWGVAELTLDARALEADQVLVRSFCGVFPSGATVRIAADGEALLARRLDNQLAPPRERLDVFLVLPLERLGAANYARAEAERGAARYWVETRNLFDSVAPEREERVDLARCNAQLRFGDEPRDDVESIKIAELVRDASGKAGLAASYVPPALRLAAAPALRAGLERVLSACLTKRRTVSEALRHRDAVSVEFAADEVTRYLALSALGGVIPGLKHLLEQPQTSAYQAYLTLSQFVGQLCAFSADEDPATLPGYQHADLRASFEPLFRTALSLLQVAVQTRVLTIPLEGRVDGLHLARLSAAELQQPGVRFLLGVQAALPEHSVHELACRLAKIAAWTEIQRYLSASVSTVPLSVCARPPRELPLRADKQYFTLEAESALFRAALREKTLAVHLPPAFAPATTHVELFAILPG
jgi:type VI secretion system protein ImpJ